MARSVYGLVCKGRFCRVNASQMFGLGKKPNCSDTVRKKWIVVSCLLPVAETSKGSRYFSAQEHQHAHAKAQTLAAASQPAHRNNFIVVPIHQRVP